MSVSPAFFNYFFDATWHAWDRSDKTRMHGELGNSLELITL